MSERFDWQEAYGRLEKLRLRLDSGVERSPEEVRRILQDRAQKLAQPLDAASSPIEVRELLVFSLSQERYGVETDHVLEVVSLRELTAVPCTPAFVLGVVNHRGRILPVMDLRRLFGLKGQGSTEGSRVIAVEVGGMTFGIFADAVAGIVRLGAHEVGPLPAALINHRQSFIQGVTQEMIAVLDVEALARGSDMVVNEEVG